MANARSLRCLDPLGVERVLWGGLLAAHPATFRVTVRLSYRSGNPQAEDDDP
jgi:hypothetical protein